MALIYKAKQLLRIKILT